MRFAPSQTKCRATLPSRLSPSPAGAGEGGRKPGEGCRGKAVRSREGRGEDAFTLAEVLAALLFMAIVIPVVVQGLEISSRAGEVATRKGEAARVAERILNENLVTTNWSTGSQNGVVTEGSQQYNWTMQTAAWPGDPDQSAMQTLSVQVTYAVQNQNYSISLSTLVGN
jgi:type II secretory pathway pseudopilin PulG